MLQQLRGSIGHLDVLRLTGFYECRVQCRGGRWRNLCIPDQGSLTIQLTDPLSQGRKALPRGLGIREDAYAIPKVQRTEALHFPPHGRSFAGRRRWHRVDQQCPRRCSLDGRLKLSQRHLAPCTKSNECYLERKGDR